MKKICLILVCLSITCLSFGQTTSLTGEVIDAATDRPIVGVNVFLEKTQELKETDKNGSFEFQNLKPGNYDFVFFAEGYNTITKTFKNIEELGKQTIQLDSLQMSLEAIEVEANKREVYGLRRLNNVEGMAIYAAKKSEVIDMKNLLANTATNNARQVYKGIAGLNIWENDGGGLQLSIGARGLDPNRTSNFNTRQNGYDISADALGYPESYYTPPVQALKRIEIVRGAASLQYGPQFGGLLNFVFKNGNPTKEFEFVSENTIGSFGLFNSFNSIGGTVKDINYYGFFQRRQGNGWRPNADFHQNTGFFSFTKTFSPKFKVGFEYTYMGYLAHQSGGLQDFEFEQNARQSKRTRNWFDVNWNLAAMTLDYRISDKTKLNSRTFYLNAQRQALGELGPINRPDPLRERDLIVGNYENFGNETRLIHRYTTGEQLATFLIGARYYQGNTQNKQGDASDSDDPDFTFLNPNDLEKSEYTFPSKNASVFAENLFNITNKWTVTPGARFEYIRTASEGYFKERVISGNQVIFEQKFEDQKENNRSLVLLGLGTGYRLDKGLEAYANFSQNYRSINFSDLSVVNPNLIVDSLLTDESGFNIDIGLRGNAFKEALRLDVSLFFLKYKDRIGTGEIIVQDPAVVERAVAFRTNIGDARIFGLETYAELDFCKLLNKEHKNLTCTVFANLSLIHGQYTSGTSDIVGNDIELIPPINIKTGLNLRWKNIQAAYQFAFVKEHFSDATNAIFVADATRGLIPSYQVSDLSLSYKIGKFKFQSGINNLTNEVYFTRRAAAYPGPGIIPADGRSFYFSAAVKL